MDCSCDSTSQLEGAEALEYVAEFLSEVRVDVGKWETEYACKCCGARWLETRPHSYYHGGGLPLLTRLPTNQPGDTVTCRCDSTGQLEDDEALAYAAEFLSEIKSDPGRWRTEYICKYCGTRWLETYPHGDYHGGNARD